MFLSTVNILPRATCNSAEPIYPIMDDPDSTWKASRPSRKKERDDSTPTASSSTNVTPVIPTTTPDVDRDVDDAPSSVATPDVPATPAEPMTVRNAAPGIFSSGSMQFSADPDDDILCQGAWVLEGAGCTGQHDVTLVLGLSAEDGQGLTTV
jgi:hypothetical protein